MKKEKKYLQVTLCLVRHARASGNRAHIFNGSRRDVPLTALGRRQAKELAQKWKGKPDVILSSPMKRAKSTAAYLARKFNMPIIIVPQAHEHDLGKWTGLSAVEMSKRYPNYFFRKKDGRITHYLKKVPGGESWRGILKRARNFLLMVRKKYAGKKVVLISHGVFILACISIIKGIKPPKLWDLHVKNAQMVCLKI
jgi:broad specificity phosphatase PhoE